MNYRVVIIETKEYVAVSCPTLKGCHSQGQTKAEALENMRNAIREWLDSAEMEKSIVSVTEEEVSV